jgi:nucleoside-diphosphate-sugar epimerase
LTVLVTGANGFVGVNIVRHLARQGAQVIAQARRPPDPETERFLAPEAERIIWVQGDVRDRAGLIALARRHQVDRIIHGAAMTPSRAVEQDQTAAVIEINLMGTVNALEAAREVGAKRFVFISSTALYGAPVNPRRLLTEDEPVTTANLYTICKWASEQVCRRYQELHGLSTVIGRLGSAYGPMERTSQSREGMSLIYDLAHRALAGERVRVFGADRLRDFCYVEDIAEAFAQLVGVEQLNWPVYNVATDIAVTSRDALETLSQLCPGFEWSQAAQAEEADIVLLPEHERAPLNLTRLRQDANYMPQYDLARDLQSYLTWLRSGEEEARFL